MVVYNNKRGGNTNLLILIYLINNKHLMIKNLLLVILTFYMVPAVSQEKEKQAILDEATLLYNSERASWHGTDIFMAKFPEKKDKIGGYFSYSVGKLHTCLFFDKETSPNVLATIAFNDSFVVEAAEVNSNNRKLNTLETDYYTIRQKALALAQNDSLFKVYNNTNLNFIPVIAGNSKKVFVLTGPSITGVVVFGNDYLIEFDKKNNITSKKALHKNIIPINYSDSENEIATMHNHLPETGEFITATDVCTLMLYSQYTHWSQHLVLSKKYVSVWDCAKESLLIMTTEAWEKMTKD